MNDEEIRNLLVSVGASPVIGSDHYDTSFEDLDLDSLARMEIAARIEERYGIDIEERLTEDETPAGMRRLVKGMLEAA